MENGSVPLYRKTLNSAVFLDEYLLKLWIYCLLKASYKKRTVSFKTGKGIVFIDLEPGQFVFGREATANKLGWKPSSLWDRMKKLKNMKNIGIQSNSQYSIISIINWDIYKIEKNKPDSEPDSEPDRQPTGNRQATDSEPDTNNKVNKVDTVDTVEKGLQEELLSGNNPERAKKTKKITSPINSETWEQYKNAYRIRYGVEPIRNAKQNSLIKKFVELVGQEAPNIIAFFLTSKNALYVRAGHDLTLAVRDAVKLTTEWKTGNQITEGFSKIQDRQGGTAAVIRKIMAERGEI